MTDFSPPSREDYDRITTAEELRKGDRVSLFGTSATVASNKPLPGGDMHLRVRLPDRTIRETFPAAVVKVWLLKK